MKKTKKQVDIRGTRKEIANMYVDLYRDYRLLLAEVEKLGVAFVSITEKYKEK